MPEEPDQFSVADLSRLTRAKHRERRGTPVLGDDLVTFFKQHVQKRQTKITQIADVWRRLIPSTLLEHTCLESFHAGTLKVLVDNSSHLFELKTVLLAGLQKQIMLACKAAGLRKIVVRYGRWYDGDNPETGKLRFD